jgi:hypothetical protein
MSARPSRRCHTSERNTDLDARNNGVSGAEPATGRELPERVQQVRAALSDTDRVRFEQDLDEALDMARRPGTCGRSATSSRASGGLCWLVSTVAGDGRRPRRGCATATSPSGECTVGRGGRDQSLPHLSRPGGT